MMTIRWIYARNAVTILSFLFPLSIFVGIILAFSQYVPLWDSRAYLTTCVMNAVAYPFDIFSFNCFNHGSFVYGLLYGFLQYVSFGNVFFIHLTTIVLMIVAFSYLYRILLTLFQDVFWAAIGTALVFWNPAILANSLNPTADLTVFAFSVMCLWAFLNERLIYASVFGAALVFSKESGVIYYGFCCLFYLIYYQQKTKKYIFFHRDSLILGWPFVFYAYFLWYKNHVAGIGLLFNDMTIKDIINDSFMNGFVFADMYVALSTMFILNFQWIVLYVIAFSAPVFALSIFANRKSMNNLAYLQAKKIGFISLLAVSLCFTLCRFPNFSNVRYYLLIFPLTSILFLYALKQMLPRWSGFLFGCLYSILLLISCFVTMDPISRYLYGTFQFGNHAMLNMTSINQECCGYGRDQLIYNLQHIQIQNLLNQFSEKVQLKKNDVILTNPEIDYNIYGNVDNTTYRFTLKLKNAHQPIYIDNPATENILHKQRNVGRIYYPELPNIQEARFKLSIMSRYKPISNFEVGHRGYRIHFIEYVPL